MPPLPPDVLAMAARGPAWERWVRTLPALLHDVLDEWSLHPDGEPMHGHASLVLPVTSDDGPAVLKLAFPDPETEHEALALQHWHGDGAVRLLRADPRRRVLLLERLHRRDLSDLWDLEACEVVAGLLGRLHVPAPPRLRTLAEHVSRWSDDLAALPRDARLPHRMVEHAVSLGRAFVDDPDTVGTAVHGDLHYANVLAADREPWLAIDPQPKSGDPHYEVAPLLWNRWDELAGDVRDGVRRRFHATVDAAGLDEDRARDWVIVRMMNNAMWAIGDAGWNDAVDHALTVCISVAKAVQD